MIKRLGSFVWFDIVSRDIPRTKAFYGEVLGWKVLPMPFGDGVYEMATVGEVPIGGYWPAEAGQAPAWLSYLSVDDVDAAAARAAAAGGAVLEPPADVPGVGRFARIADPEGATFHLFRNDDDDTPPTTGHGSLFWTELLCRKPEAMASFYERVAGFTRHDMTVGGQPYIVLRHGGEDRVGLTASHLVDQPPFWVTYVTVDDCDAAVARVRALGGTVYDAPSDTPGIGRTALVAAPDGVKLGLIKPAQT
jgi:predicted enzyme related to lactoylglutathione lyase